MVVLNFFKHILCKLRTLFNKFNVNQLIIINKKIIKISYKKLKYSWKFVGLHLMFDIILIKSNQLHSIRCNLKT